MELPNDGEQVPVRHEKANTVHEAAGAPVSSDSYVKKSIMRNVWLIIGVFALIVVLVAVIAAIMVKDGDNKTVASSNTAININEYQALFLTNGQVYFGKLSNLDSRYVTLSDIYYLQVQQNSTTTQGSAADLNSQSQVSLAKLGSELHGPEDKMQVASDQVLFWENMKPDSKVSQAITKYQAK